MKRYELVKYKYGLKPHVFTAFGIAERKKDGQFRVLRHFQTPEGAKAYLSGIKAEIVDADWAELPGTGISGIRQTTEKMAKPMQLTLEVA